MARSWAQETAETLLARADARMYAVKQCRYGE